MICLQAGPTTAAYGDRTADYLDEEASCWHSTCGHEATRASTGRE